MPLSVQLEFHIIRPLTIITSSAATMSKRNDQVNDSDESLSDAMSDYELEELKKLVSSSPARKPTSAPDVKRSKKPVKGGRTSAELVVEKSDGHSVDLNEDKKRPTNTATKPTNPGRAKSKSVSDETDDRHTNGDIDEPKPTNKKTPARSGRDVAKVISKKKASQKRNQHLQRLHLRRQLQKTMKLKPPKQQKVQRYSR